MIFGFVSASEKNFFKIIMNCVCSGLQSLFTLRLQAYREMRWENNDISPFSAAAAAKRIQNTNVVASSSLDGVEWKKIDHLTTLSQIESSMRVTTFHVGSLAVFYEVIRRLAYKAQQIDALNYKIWLKHQNKCESHQQHTAKHNKHNGKEWVTVTDLRSAVIYQTPNDFSHYIRFQFSSRRHWKWISNHDRFSVLSACFRLAPYRQQRRFEVKEGNIVCVQSCFEDAEIIVIICSGKGRRALIFGIPNTD